MAKLGARTGWRRLFVLLIMTSGAVLAWVAARRRTSQAGEAPTLAWSSPDPPALAPGVRAPAASPQRVASAPEPLAARTAPVAAADPVSELDPVAQPAAEPEHLFTPTMEPSPGPYPRSALPLEDGSAPSEEFVVKANAGSMRCHAPHSPYYRRTRAEVWFRTEADAVAAGFRPWAARK